MLTIRPSLTADLAAIATIASHAPVGVTSLRAGSVLLSERIEASCAAFAEAVTEAGDQRYLFSLLDATTRQVIGVAGMVAAVGLVEPFYNYRRETLVHASRPLGIHNQVEVLSLCHDLTGASLLHAFALLPQAQSATAVELLCRSRLLFAAAHPQRFAERWVCELLGMCDAADQSPVWDSLGRYFFGIDYAQAEEYCAGKGRSFIAELLPQHPIYVSLLTPAAQAALGVIHPRAAPSAEVLLREGFSVGRYVDIFDGGPVVEARRDDLATLRNYRRYSASVVDRLHADGLLLLANAGIESFRAVLAPAALDPEQAQAMITRDTAAALQIESGATLLVAGGGHNAGTFDPA